MRRSNLNSSFLFALLMGWGFLVSGSSLGSSPEITGATVNSVSKTVTLNGVKFPIPKGYVLAQGTDLENTVFLFYKKYNEGLFISVPPATFNQVELLNSNTEIALNKFFPGSSQAYTWKPLNDRRKISKFEIGTSKSMGFDKKNLVILQVHHFLVAGRHLFIGDLFKWTHGNLQEMFATGRGGESMQGCNDLVEIVYSITGEKIDDTNSPCELIALPPG